MGLNNNNNNTSEAPSFGTRSERPPTPLWDWFTTAQALTNQLGIQGQTLGALGFV
jgi:hypothetical protein